MNRPSPIRESTLDALHASFHEIYTRLASASFETLVRDLRSLLQRHQREFQAAPVEWLGLRRRVAETTLTVAISKQRPVDECERLLANIRELGWSDLHRRAQMETMFCGYCVRIGHTEIARPYVHPLMASLQKANETTRDATWANHLAACEKLIARMRE